MGMQKEHSDDVEKVAALLGNTTDTDVKVVVRVRPVVLGSELQQDVQTCVEAEGHNRLVVRSGNETTNMQFNWVAGPATTQADFFKVVGKPTVENCLSGFNSCIFAYGQTGSGKTHTLIGELPQDSDGLPTNAGLIPRILQYLWRRMPEVQASMLSHCAASMTTAAAQNGIDTSSNEPSLTWLVRCSMLEIHREDIIDLLRPGNGPLTLREDIRKGVYVEGLCETVVENVQDALAVLQQGIANRQVASNDYHAASSRSHCIFTCYVESRLEPQPGLVNVRSSRLHLVDLAGSERLRHGLGGLGSSESSERLLKETTSINSSLTVLGMVILKLTEQQPHIPYRNSKLTFLLQDSIGGNAKTVIVANVSPSEVAVQETMSTLGFASRARKLVNKAVINEDTSGDAAVLRAENKRLKSELVLARQLIQHSTAHANGQTAAELEEQQAQLQQALTMLAELGNRNSELEDALEYSKRERCELERGCLEARQELAAVQVTLQQTMRENRSWRHRSFKVDSSSRSLASSRALSESGAEAAPAAGPSAAFGAAAVPFGQPETAAAAVTVINDSGTLSYTEQDQHTEPILKLLNSRLTELVSTVRPAAVRSDQSGYAETTTALGQKVRQSLADLASICKPRVVEVPELSSVVDSLELIATWQQYQSAATGLGADTADAAAVGSHTAACATVSGIPKTSFTPFELHRQLREERQLNAKLSEQVRQLQQKLLLAAETAGAAGKNLLSQSSDSMLRGSCITTLQAAADAADTADSAVAAVAARQGQQQPVVVQLNIWDGAEAEPEQLELAAAKAKVAGLQQQVAQLQEQLDAVSRERAGLQGRLASARTVLAAARCLTPSSLNSSRLPSPQPCFSPLRSIIGESIDEGIEEDYEGVPPPGSWRSRHKPPGSPNTPVKHISTPLSSHNSHELTAESSGPLAEEDSETFLSPQTHWDREHSRYQQHQQELEKRKNLARAVHAAIKGAGCPEKNSPGHRHPSPAGVSASASDQRSPSLRPYAADCDSTPVEGSYSRLSASIDQLQQQLQQAVTDTRVVLSGTPGKAVRASSDNVDGFSCGSRQQQQQQLKHSSGAKSASAAAGRLESDVSELLCRTAGLLMPGSAPAAAGTTAVGLQILYADSPAGLRTVNAVQDTAVQGTSPHFNADGSTGHMGEGTQAAETSMNTTSACFAAASEAAATSSATAAEAEQSTDEAGNELQQRQQPTPGPAWEMEDYEEEFRQLQEQLQELLTANSGLKATVQQRERALADKDAQLEQQGHDLECCEQMVQELHERLATSEAAAAAAAAEHCTAIWFKGQYEGLLEMNEMQGQEIQELKAALERFMTTEAAPQTAEAYAAAAELYYSDSLVDSLLGNSTAEQHVENSAPATNGRNSSEAACSAHVMTPHGDEASLGSHEVSTSLADDPEAAAELQQLPNQNECMTGTAAVAAMAAGHDPQSSTANDSHEQQQQSDGVLAESTAAQNPVRIMDDAEPAAVMSPASAAVIGTDVALGTPAVISTPAADNQVTPVSIGSSKHTAGQPGSHRSSVQQRLLLQTSQLAAQPADPEIAANQAILLRHQLEAVGLQLQQKQLEAKLAHVKLQMERLQQHQQAQLHHQQMQLQRYQQHRQQLGQGYLTPAGSQHKLLLGAAAGSFGSSSSGTDQPLSSSSGSPLFARLNGDSTLGSRQRPNIAVQHDTAEPTSRIKALKVDQDMQASKNSPLPLMLDRSGSSDAAAVSANGNDEAKPETAVTPRSARSSSPGCIVDGSSSSCRSSFSDASSSGQCFDMITDLVQRLNALAQEQHDTSTFKAASASTLSPMPASKLSWPAAAAAQLQTRLQVSSAYELDAAREMVAMTENLIGLQAELHTAEKAPRSRRTQQRRRQQPQLADLQQLEAAESSVVTSLLSRFDTVQPSAEAAPATEVCGTADVPLDGQQEQRAHDLNTRLPEVDNQQLAQQPSVSWLQLVARLEQQQQSILKALEANSSVGSDDLAGMQAMHQQLLQQLRSTATTAPAVPPRRDPVLHNEGSWQSVDSAHGRPEITSPGQQVQQQQQQQDSQLPPILPDTCPQVAQEIATSVSKTPRSASPAKRQLRSRKRQMLRRSLDSSLGAVASTPVRQDVSDEHHLRDSCKGDRLQQLLLEGKAGILRSSTAAEACDADCQTDAEEAPPPADSRLAQQPLELQLVAAHLPGSPQQQGEKFAGMQSPDQEVTQLKGEVAKLRLQVDQFKTRAKVAEEGRLRLAQAVPRSYSSLSSRADLDCRSSVEGSDYGSGLIADVTSSTGSATAANRPPIVPAGLFSPRAAAASMSGGCDSPPGAVSFKLPQQPSCLPLYNRFTELQAQFMSQAQTIQHLENQVRQQGMQLQQAGVGMSASAAGSGGSWGGSTPRAGLLSPRIGLGAFSPRVIPLTPNKSFAVSDKTTGDGTVGHNALSVGTSYNTGNGGNTSPTKASRLGGKAASAAVTTTLGGSGVGWFSSKPLAVVPETSPSKQQQLGEYMELDNPLFSSAKAVVAVAADRGSLTSNSRRRLSLGSAAVKGHKLGGIGRLRVAALSKASQRRQSLEM